MNHGWRDRYPVGRFAVLKSIAFCNVLSGCQKHLSFCKKETRIASLFNLSRMKRAAPPLAVSLTR
jgi:hypothetical protein